MVSSLAIAFMVVSIVLSLLLPIGLVVYLYRRVHIPLRAVMVGAATFVVSQMILRIPLLNAFANQPWYQAAEANVWLLATFLSVTAALFEETGRWLAFRYLLPRQRDYKGGIAFGLGHGGIESILLAGSALVANLLLALAINSGTFDTTMAPQLGLEADVIKDQLVNTQPALFLAAGLERVFAMTIHVALSLLVLCGVRSGQLVYWVYALLFHTAVNFPVAPVSAAGWSPWYTELWVGLMAVIAVVMAARLRSRLQEQA